MINSIELDILSLTKYSGLSIIKDNLPVTDQGMGGSGFGQGMH